MKIILLLTSVLTLTCSVFAQKHTLYLKNTTTGQEVIIKEKEKIGIVTYSDKLSKGRLAFVNDSLLVVDGDTASISQLKEVKTQIPSAIVVGSIIKIVCGAAFVANIAYGLKNKNADVVVPGSVLFLIAGGGMWIHSLYATYRTDEWTVRAQ